MPPILRLAAALVLAPSLASAMPLTLVRTLQLAAPQSNDRFGASVALDASGAYVGATYDAVGSSRGGSVTVFNAGTGAVVRTITNPGGLSQQFFGQSLALDATGLLVGAVRGGVSGTGTAHLFDKTTGAFVRSFVDPTPVFADNFGDAVALAGSVVLIGAPGTDSTGGPNETGAAYRFDRTGPAPTNAFAPVSPSYGEGYGIAVAIDGSRLLVGNGGKGTVEVRDSATGALLRTITGPAGTGFGLALAASGGRVLVGGPSYYAGGAASSSGAAYLHDIETGALLRTFLNPTPGTLDLFGRTLALSGTRALIASYFDDTGAEDSGSAYLYDLADGTLIQTILNPDPDAMDHFGTSVALYGDMALIGAPDAEGQGRAYLYAPVPLPPPLALIGAGVVVFGTLRRRKPVGAVT